jgi:hypothetical protein
MICLQGEREKREGEAEKRSKGSHHFLFSLDPGGNGVRRKGTKRRRVRGEKGRGGGTGLDDVRD